MYDYLCKRIIKAMNINRELSKAEYQYIVDWKEKLCMKDEIVLEAVKRTVNLKKERANFSYVNAILENWYKNNVKTFTDILSLDEAYRKNKYSDNSALKEKTNKSQKNITVATDKTTDTENNYAIKVIRLTDTAKLSIRRSTNIAEYELFSDNNKNITIMPHEIKKISTGIKIQFPKGYAGIIYSDKNTIGASPVFAISSVEGNKDDEIIVCLINSGNSSYEIKPGDMIALICIVRSLGAK